MENSSPTIGFQRKETVNNRAPQLSAPNLPVCLLR
jgi:hypothetical protein